MDGPLIRLGFCGAEAATTSSFDADCVTNSPQRVGAEDAGLKGRWYGGLATRRIFSVDRMRSGSEGDVKEFYFKS
jgi:hypothetical protein